MNSKTLVGNPRVSIGIPVYNGENYLEQALDSILAQSYEDFEVIISDNASTDRTEEICQAYASKDRRVKYFRNSTNIGSGRNFNRVFELAKGEYFKWTAHDDICSKDYIKSCVEILDSDPSVVLCNPAEVMIDATGEELPDYAEAHRYAELVNIEGTKPYKRLYDLACLWHACFQIFGVVRSEVLKKTPLIGVYVGTDRVLLAELALYGRFCEVPEPIYFRRHAEQYCALESAQSQAEWYDPENTAMPAGHTYKNLGEYLRAIGRAPLSRGQQLLCYMVMAVWALKKRRRLGRELKSVFIRSSDRAHA